MGDSEQLLACSKEQFGRTEYPWCSSRICMQDGQLSPLVLRGAVISKPTHCTVTEPTLIKGTLLVTILLDMLMCQSTLCVEVLGFTSQ